jgi:hypothetical protein
MNVTISVAGPDAAVEELRDLFRSLRGEEELRGRVELVEAAPEPGTLGGWPESVVVTLTQSGTVTILASAVITWIRYRTGRMTCTMTRSDGTSVWLDLDRIRDMDPAEVAKLVERTAAALGEGARAGSAE